jgi:hypothetical protein
MTRRVGPCGGRGIVEKLGVHLDLEEPVEGLGARMLVLADADDGPAGHLGAGFFEEACRADDNALARPLAARHLDLSQYPERRPAQD